MISPDLYGIITILNDLYQRAPGKFGSDETQESLKKEIAEYLEKDDKNVYRNPEFYTFLANRFDEHQLAPLKDISIAVVGGWNDIYNLQTVEPALPILERFEKFHDIAIRTKKALLHTNNALELSEGQKVDYVLTGNVINDTRFNIDTILACANLLKKDGRAVHMLGFSENPHSGNIESDTLQKFAGQKHLQNVPAGPYNPKGYNTSDTQIMIVAQEHEVNYTMQHSLFYQAYKAHENRVKEGGKEVTYRTSDGGCKFTEKKFYDYFLEHPDRLPTISALPEDLEIGTDFQDKPEKAKVTAQRYVRFGYKLPEGMTLDNDTALSKKDADNILESCTQWRDDLLRTVKVEITPSHEITDDRYYSTGKVSPLTRFTNLFRNS